MRAAGEAPTNSCVRQARRPRPAGSKVTAQPGHRSQREEDAGDHPVPLLGGAEGSGGAFRTSLVFSFRSVFVDSMWLGQAMEPMAAVSVLIALRSRGAGDGE